MTTTINDDKLQLLLAARLLRRLKKPSRPNDERKYLRRYLSHLEPAIADAAFDRAHEGALAANWIGDAFELTDQGRDALAAAFGADVLTLRKWDQIERRVLLPLALNALPTSAVRKRLAETSKRGPQGLILQRYLGAPGREAPTMNQVMDTQVWKAFGVESDAPVSTNVAKLRGLALARALGSERQLDVLEAIRLGVRLATGSMDPGLPAATTALVRRWASEGEGASLVDAAPVETPTPAAKAPQSPPRESKPDLRAFADDVLSVARHSETRRFGEGLAFIGSVWRELGRGASGAAPDTREAFDAELLAAHRAGLLELARADLVQAMDADDVRSSELRAGGAVFHFIRTPAR